MPKQRYWDRTSAWVFSCKFAEYFQNTFFSEHLWTTAFEKIQSILRNIEYHLPLMSEMKQWSLEMIHVTKSFVEAVVDADNQNWKSIFPCNPDIVAEHIDHFIKLLPLKHLSDSIRELIRLFQDHQHNINQLVNLFTLIQVHK